MDGEAVKELAERFREPKEIDGLIAYPNDWHLADPVSAVKPGPQADALKVYTLGAVRDYLKANRDALDLATLVVHVVSPQIVRLAGKLQERARNREVFVEASATNLADGFLGKFMPIEEFIIGLQARFVETDARQAVLRLFSNIKSEVVKTAQDDGISQSVTAKAGVALVSDVTVPNPVTLTPFRTFREVTQPESSFVLRVQATKGFEAGLFEADGGAWRLVAVDRVRDWLTHELPEGVAVLG